MMIRCQQQGAALLLALFMITIAASLAAFAIRMGVHQESSTNLTLLQARARSAANAGLEVWSYRVARAVTTGGIPPACLGINSVINIGSHPGLAGFSVRVLECTRITSVNGARTDAVYEIRVVGSTGAFGRVGFARQEVSRRISTFGGAPGIGTY